MIGMPRKDRGCPEQLFHQHRPGQQMRPGRRAERQRKYRTQTDYGRNEMEFDPPPASEVAYVNPFAAAAGGAAVGATATSVLSHHDDHGHGDQDHGDQAPVESQAHEPFAEPLHEPQATANPGWYVTPPTPGESSSDHGQTEAGQARQDDPHKEPEPAH